MTIKAITLKNTQYSKDALLTQAAQNQEKTVTNDKVILHNEEESFIKNVKQLTFDGESGEGYFSKDAKKVIFQAKRDGRPSDQIYMMDADGSNQKLISNGKGKAICSYFRPDGKKIIYSSTMHNPKVQSDKPSTKNYVWDFDPELEIYEADPDGSNLKRLTKAYGYDAEATYSNKGDKIVFTSYRDGDLELYVMNADGTDQKRLTYTKGYDGGAFFSPDDKEIVYRRFDDPNNLKASNIFIMGADGKNERQVTNLKWVNWSPSYHPSGKYIVFSSNYETPRNFDLYIIRPDGTGLKRVTHDEGFDGLPIFSDDGKKILWSSNRGENQAQQLFIADWVYNDEGAGFLPSMPPGFIQSGYVENPIGPSPKAVEAVENASSIFNQHVYFELQPLVNKLAEHHKIDKSMVICSNGATEVLKLVPRAFLSSGGSLVCTRETYETTPLEAKKIGATIYEVPHKPDWTLDYRDILNALQPDTKVVYLVNPNNPTGSFLNYGDLKSLAGALPKDVILFIDEAYNDYISGDKRGGIDLVKEGFKNVLTVRTFSKAHGLAGLRIGYGIGDPEIIKRLTTEQGGAESQNVILNMPGVVGAMAALDDTEHVEKSVTHVNQCKTFYEEEFKKMGLEYITGFVPFISVKVPNPADIVKSFMKKGILLRDGATLGMPGYVRIVFGKEEENKRIISALREALNI